MKFENPPVNHAVNVTREHPLKEFFQLTLGFLVLGVIALLLIHYSAGYFATKIPFRYESAMVSHIDALKPEPSAQRDVLQAMANQLGKQMDLPADMTITVHYSDDDTVNAFATLGGHVFFYKGLIQKLETEDALAMVMAHEIAHVKHRHPIVAMGKGITLVALMGSLLGASGSAAGETIMGKTVQIGLLKFSRDQERQSDQSAAMAINAVYGHIRGAEHLFTLFDQIAGGSKPPKVLSSHPHSIDRWQTLKGLAAENGWMISGDTTPLRFEF